MNRKWFSIAALFITAALLLSASSCARSQQLVSISVQPTSVTFLSPSTNLTFQLKAYGNYIHPPETKDITNLATWQSQSADLVTVTSAGVVSAAGAGHCGVTSVIASVFTNSGNPNGNVVTSSITATVDDRTDPVCPQ